MSSISLLLCAMLFSGLVTMGLSGYSPAKVKPHKLATPKLNQTKRFLEDLMTEEEGRLLETWRLHHRQIDTTARDDMDRTALYLAADRGFSSLVERLITESNANVDAPDAAGLTPLGIALIHGHCSTAEQLISHGASFTRTLKNGRPVAFAALVQGNADCLQRLENRGLDFTFTPESGAGAVTMAAEFGNLSALSYLIETRGLSPDGNAKVRPLILAIYRNKPQALAFLLTHKAKLNVVDADGDTPLGAAVFKGDYRLLKRLLDLGADPNLRVGKPPLSMAASRGDLAALHLLLARGAGVNRVDEEGTTALMTAVQNGQAGAVVLLLEKGADPNLATPQGDTALSLALDAEQESCAALLEEVGAKGGKDPLVWEHTYTSALARARAEGKLVFMDLWAEWCGPCQEMKQSVFKDPNVREALRDLVPLSAMVQTKDSEDVPENSALAEGFNLKAFPTLVVLDADGKELRRHVGGMTPDAFIAFLKGEGGGEDK